MTTKEMEIQSEQSSSSTFSSQLGFILTAAGSAVGVGNLWRFPYLAAKDGGGLFLLIYLALVLTFGFALLASDLAIGRKTKKSAIRAYEAMHKKWKFVGLLTFVVPVLIMTYYAVIGGWITKYVMVYVTGQSQLAATDTYFSNFVSSPISPLVYGLFFMALTAAIVYAGVQGGLETVSKFCMPFMIAVVLCTAIFVMTLSFTDGSGTVRTGLEGLLVYLKPDFTGLTFGRFLQILLDAASQLFFSLSVSMGIMITFGSYVKKDVNLSKCISRIELFDTGVALLAGAMIIPAIYVFSGTEGMAAGPSLMFLSLPKVFSSMGPTGTVVGFLFFVMTALAALTSCISVLEAIVSNCMELYGWSRKKAVLLLSAIYLVATAVISLGYSVFYLDIALPNGTSGQLLDLMDYVSNSLLMPVIAFLSCILIGWVIKPKWIIEEMEVDNATFGRKRLYVVMVKYIMPVILFVLFLQSTGMARLFGF